MRLTVTTLLVLGLAACSGRDDTEIPPDREAPVAAPPSVAPTAAAQGGMARSFVGRWTAQPEWCLNPVGAQRPIEITLDRFEGYENSCSIDQIDEANGSWTLALTCQAEGETRQERVTAAVAGDQLTLTWAGPHNDPITFARCTTLAEAAR